MNMQIFRLMLCVFLSFSVALLSGCERMHDMGMTDEMEGLGEEIFIGVVLPQTGDLGAGEFGLGALVMENGFNMALDEINASQLIGHTTLNFIVEDDMSTVEGTIAAFNKLIYQDNVPVILGVWTSHVAQSVFPIAQENRVVAFSPVVIAAGLTDIGGFIFRGCNTTNFLIPPGIKITQEKLGYQKVVTIADSVDFAARDADAVFRKALTDNGVEVLTTETFKTGDTDFSNQLIRINALAPDAIFVSAQHRETIRILTQARELGISQDTSIVSFLLSIDEIQQVGDAAEGVITFTDWVKTADTPSNQAFVENYTAKYGIEPSAWAAQSYAAVYTLAEAIRNAQSTDSEAIAASLAEIKDFDTVLGKFSFAPNGDAIYDPVVLIVKNGKLEVFE